MLGVYHIMARIIITKYAHEFKKCEMLESLATTSVHCWLTHARLVRLSHTPLCISMVSGVCVQGM